MVTRVVWFRVIPVTVAVVHILPECYRSLVLVGLSRGSVSAVVRGHTECMSLRMYTGYPAGGTTESMRGAIAKAPQAGDESLRKRREYHRGCSLLSFFPAR